MKTVERNGRMDSREGKVGNIKFVNKVESDISENSVSYNYIVRKILSSFPFFTPYQTKTREQ